MHTSSAGQAPLGGLLRRHRLERDLTIEVLSELSGVSDRTIGDIERGVSAGPQARTIVALAEALALDDGARDVFLAAARAGRRTSSDRRGGDAHRPHWLEDFTGREQELARLADVLSGSVDDTTPHAPIIVSGAPGVGKTSLAIEAVRRSGREGRRELFLDLGSTTPRTLTPLRVLQELIGQLAPGQETPRTIAAASALWRELTARTPVIVLLDDATMESQVRPVLTFDGRSRVVVTSRRSLPGLEAARHIAIGALSRDESIAFLERTIPAAQRTGTDLDDLAMLCGDLPLALRVTVGRIVAQASRSAAEFARQLRVEDRRLQLLVAGDLGVERAFAVSCNLLAPSPRGVFQSVALLRGTSFSAPLGAAVAGVAAPDTQDLLDELVELGLVEALEGGRLRIHELLRLYAEKVLRSEATEDAIRERLQRANRWLLATAARAGAMFAPDPTVPEPWDVAPPVEFEGPDDARAWLVDEAQYWYPALQEAAAQGRFDDVLRAVAGIRWFGDRWLEWGRWHQLFALAAAAAEAVGDLALQADLLADVAFMELTERFDPARAAAVAREAVSVASAAGHDIARAWALTQLGASEAELGHLVDAEAHAREAIRLFAAQGDLEGELQPRQTLVDVMATRDPAAAVAELRRAIEITDDPAARLSPHYRRSAREASMVQLARTLVDMARYEEAIQVASDLDGLFADDARAQARARRHRGFAYLGLGESEKARADLSSALELAGAYRPDAWAAEIEAALRDL